MKMESVKFNYWQILRSERYFIQQVLEVISKISVTVMVRSLECDVMVYIIDLRSLCIDMFM